MLEIIGIIAIICNLACVIAGIFSIRDEIFMRLKNDNTIGKIRLMIRILIIGALLIIFGSLAINLFDSLDIELF